jgi:hypothetical protein
MSDRIYAPHTLEAQQWAQHPHCFSTSRSRLRLVGARLFLPAAESRQQTRQGAKKRREDRHAGAAASWRSRRSEGRGAHRVSCAARA